MRDGAPAGPTLILGSWSPSLLSGFGKTRGVRGFHVPATMDLLLSKTEKSKANG